MDIRGDLEQSMSEEEAAAAAYRKRAADAYAEEDYTTARLWEHIAAEEDGHYYEFRDRLSALPERLPPTYDGWRYAKVGFTEMRGKTTPTGIQFEQVSPSYDPSDLDEAVEIITRALRQRPFPQTYGGWVDLAEDIKAKYPDPIMRESVNFRLQHIAREDELAEESKRWLVQKAGELGIT